MKKIPKFLLIILASISLIILLVFLVAPPLAKWYLEGHAKELSGRKITVDKIAVNPFTAGITIKQLTVFEKNDADAFFSFEDLFLNIAFWKTVSGAFTIEEVSVSGAKLAVVQDLKGFNFDDLMERFLPEDTLNTDSTAEEPFHYVVRNLSLKECELSYTDKTVNMAMSFIHLNGACPIMAWNNPNHHYSFDFDVKSGGKVNGVFDMNIESLAYSTRYEVSKLNLSFLLPIITDIMKVSSFEGYLSCKQYVKGNMNEPQAIALSGDFIVNDVMLTDDVKQPLIGVGNVNVIIDSVNLKSDLYNFSGINIKKPFIKFELYTTGNNITNLLYSTSTEPASVAKDTMAASPTSSVEENMFTMIAAYARELAANYTFTNYKADKISLTEGTLIFNDFTLTREFRYLLENLIIEADKVNSANKSLTFAAASTLNHSGKLTGELKMDPANFQNMEFNYEIRDLLISDFNPYSNYYTAYPFDGVCFYLSKNSIKDRKLKSENRFEIKRMVVGKKEKNSTAMKLPVKLAVALLRDKDGNVLIEIPIEGDLDDPKYRLGRVIWQVFKNIIGKAVAAPGKLLAKRTGTNERDLQGLEWSPLQTETDPLILKSLDAIAKVLEATPDMNVQLIREYNIQLEKEELALQEAKKKYLISLGQISAAAGLSQEEKMKIKLVNTNDTLFVSYLNEQVKEIATNQSPTDKSLLFIGNALVEEKLKQIFSDRDSAVTNYLIGVKGVDSKRFHITNPQEEKKIAPGTHSRCEIGFGVIEE